MWKESSVLMLCLASALRVSEASVSAQDLNEVSEKDFVKVNKCCELSEIFLDGRCRDAKEIGLETWTPTFSSEQGVDNIVLPGYTFVIGVPKCDHTQSGVYHLRDSQDRLVLLTTGYLRHYINHEQQSERFSDFDMAPVGSYGRINEPVPILEEPMYHDHEQGKYCLDKAYLTDNNETALFALICVPKVEIDWADINFLLRKIINPLLHAVAMICYLVVSIIYFILPTLRDLTGNIVTTISICLIVSQAADLVRIFTELSSHVSFMIADILLYMSLLAAFFWLNSMGYYIWKMFKSRNVFLRVTDARKYCYYSIFAWGFTLLLTIMAIFAHFTLDTANSISQKKIKSTSVISEDENETIGWLGIAIFFTPIAFTAIINIFFYVTTSKVIKALHHYRGRIHHKLKRSFEMFFQMFIIMTIAWFFLLMSWLQYDAVFYCHILVNAVQAPLILYVCVLQQKHVTFLLRKSCCYNEPVPTSDWGDEMVHMNGNNY